MRGRPAEGIGGFGTLARITARVRLLTSWRTWKRLGLEDVATRRLEQSLSEVGAHVYLLVLFDWWRRVVLSMRISAEEAHKRAARLFGHALEEVERTFESGAFVWWKLTHGAREPKTRRHGRIRSGHAALAPEFGGGRACVLATQL